MSHLVNNQITRPKIIASIVVFNPKINILVKTIQSFLDDYDNSQVYVWDNSEVTNSLKKSLNTYFTENVFLITDGKNLGYGIGNNRVFENIKNQEFEYFCILNPDLEIPAGSIRTLTDFMEKHQSYGLATGLIQDLSGNIQKVHKLIPSFYDYVTVLAKRFLLKINAETTSNDNFEYPSHNFSLPIISGCFMFFRKSHFQELKGFDKHFFLYFEDYDLSLRSYLLQKSVILPEVKIIHHWARDSHKKIKLFLIQFKSGIYFYKKWGFKSTFSKKINNQVKTVLGQRSEQH